jgi:hypothetical protein
MSSKLNRNEDAKFWVFGRIHPAFDKPYKRKDGLPFDPDDDFTRDEIAHFDVSDIPISIEHQSNVEIGKIKSYFTGEKGDKYVLFYLNTDTFGGSVGRSLIDVGLMKDLSLGHSVSLYKLPQNKYTTLKKSKEVSLVEESRFDDTCKILWADYQKSFREKYHKGKGIDVFLSLYLFFFILHPCIWIMEGLVVNWKKIYHNFFSVEVGNSKKVIFFTK